MDSLEAATSEGNTGESNQRNKKDGEEGGHEFQLDEEKGHDQTESRSEDFLSDIVEENQEKNDTSAEVENVQENLTMQKETEEGEGHNIHKEDMSAEEDESEEGSLSEKKPEKSLSACSAPKTAEESSTSKMETADMEDNIHSAEVINNDNENETVGDNEHAEEVKEVAENDNTPKEEDEVAKDDNTPIEGDDVAKNDNTPKEGDELSHSGSVLRLPIFAAKGNYEILDSIETDLTEKEQVPTKSEGSSPDIDWLKKSDEICAKISDSEDGSNDQPYPETDQKEVELFRKDFDKTHKIEVKSETQEVKNKVDKASLSQDSSLNFENRIGQENIRSNKEIVNDVRKDDELKEEPKVSDNKIISPDHVENISKQVIPGNLEKIACVTSELAKTSWSDDETEMPLPKYIDDFSPERNQDARLDSPNAVDDFRYLDRELDITTQKTDSHKSKFKEVTSKEIRGGKCEKESSSVKSDMKSGSGNSISEKKLKEKRKEKFWVDDIAIQRVVKNDGASDAKDIAAIDADIENDYGNIFSRTEPSVVPIPMFSRSKSKPKKEDGDSGLLITVKGDSEDRSVAQKELGKRKEKVDSERSRRHSDRTQSESRDSKLRKSMESESESNRKKDLSEDWRKTKKKHKRQRERSRSKEHRSRSRSRERRQRSKSRSLERKRSNSRSRERKGRSRSRSRERKNRSRSRSRERKNRSRSRDRKRPHRHERGRSRSLSREYERARSKEKSYKKAKRDRSKDDTRLRQRSRAKDSPTSFRRLEKEKQDQIVNELFPGPGAKRIRREKGDNQTKKPKLITTDAEPIVILSDDEDENTPSKSSHIYKSPVKDDSQKSDAVDDKNKENHIQPIITLRLSDRGDTSDSVREKRDPKESRVLTFVPPLPESSVATVPPIPPPVIPSVIAGQPPLPQFVEGGKAEGEYDPAFPTDDMEECSPTPDQHIYMEESAAPPRIQTFAPHDVSHDMDMMSHDNLPYQRMSPSVHLSQPLGSMSPGVPAHSQAHPVQTISPLNPQQTISPLNPQVTAGLPPTGASIHGDAGTILLPGGPGEPPTLLQQPPHPPLQLRMLPPALQATLAAQQQRPMLVNQMLVNRPNPFANLQRLPPGHPMQPRIGIPMSGPAGMVSMGGLAPRLPLGTLPGQHGLLNGGFDPMHPDSQHPMHLLSADPRGDPRLHHPESPFVTLPHDTPNVSVTTPEGVPLSIASEQLSQITKLLQTQAHLAMISKPEQSHLAESSLPFGDNPQFHPTQDRLQSFSECPPVSRSEGLLPLPDRPPMTREGLLPTPNLPPMSRSGLLPLPDQPPVSGMDSNTFSDIKGRSRDLSVFKVPLLPAPVIGNHSNKVRIPGLTLSNAEKGNESIGEMDMDITSPLDDGNIEIPTSSSDQNISSGSAGEGRRKERHHRHKDRDKEKENSRKSKDRHHRHRGDKERRKEKEFEEEKEMENVKEREKNVSSTSLGMDMAEPYDVYDDMTGADEIPSSAVELTNKEKYLKKLHLQERVVDEVKTALKPFYHSKKITKEQYKDILRRSVPKVCHSKSGDINPVKIRALVEAYVGKFQRGKEKNSVANGERTKLLV